MFALFHLIFMLAKIAIQSSVYATVLLILTRLISRYKAGGFIDRTSKDKTRFWRTTGFAVSFLLFVFAFTYWGDHGLGDGSRIPVGYGQEIRNGDGVFSYFYSNDGSQRQILNFQIKDSLLFAEQDNNKYLVFDFKNSELREFESIEDYERVANENGFPMTTEFKDFIVHYHDYWNGWRFWCLA